MSDKDEPWTADDIRKNAPNWSLHCDGKLLEYMKNLSRTIEERGNRTTYNLHNSMLQLDRTKIVLENATNNLMALQHKQFVENRVYDDDETLANIDNVPVTDTEQTDKPNISAADVIREAIETGMKLLNEHFDKVTYELSDSDDDDGDEVEKSVVFRPKNPYKHRPLPYLIGSKEWHEKWHIGLVEEDSDQSENENDKDEAEEEEDDEEGARSLSSSPAISVSSNVPVSLSESENLVGVLAPKRLNAQNLFQSSSEENVPKLPHEIADSDLTFRRPSHDANVAKAAQIPKRISDANEISANNSIFMPQKAQITHAIPTLIDSDPPDLDDMPSTSASARNAHKPPNLFLDDDDDENENENDFIFSSNKQSKDEKTQQRTLGGTKINSINLFADEDGNESDNFDSFLPTTSEAPVTIARSNQRKSEPVRNLFDNDEDDDDDELFLPAASKTDSQRSTILSDAPKKDVFQYNLFDDKPPDDDFESISSSAKVNLFAEDDNDDDDDIFEKLITPSSSKKQPIKEDYRHEIDFEAESNEQKIVTTEQQKPTSSSISNKQNLFNPRGLFDDTPPSDDDDNQLFSGMSRKKDDVTNDKPQPVDAVVKKSTKEFYNDFSETITAVSQADKMVETPEAMEAPKPTNIPEKNDSISKVSKKTPPLIEDKPKQEQKPVSAFKSDGNNDTDDASIGNKRSEFMKRIDAFSNTTVNESKSEADVPVPKARQPKKLNIGSIDINVAALLPGAKRAKSVDKTDNKDHSDDISSSDDTSAASQTTTSITKTISQDNIDSSGRLVNLNRNRAKNLSRRPSTRAGRQQQYRNSMDSEEIDGISNLIENEIVQPPAIDNTEKSRSPIKAPAKSPISKVIFEDEDMFEESAPAESTQEPSRIPSSSPIENTEQIASAVVKEEENPNTFSFLDDEENDENEEFLYTKPKSSSEYTSTAVPPVKATPAFIDDLPPDLDSIEDKPYDSKSAKGTSLSQNALSLFGDEDDDDDDFDNDEIFNYRADQPPDLPSDTTPPSSVEKQQQQPVSSALSLFDDDDPNNDRLDDDDIFGTKTIPAPRPISNIKGTAESPPTNSGVAKKHFDSSIFGDFDDDPPIDTTSRNSIVSNVEETKQRPKSPTVDKNLPASSVLGLFDDDDDADEADLFGAKFVPKSTSNAPKGQAEKEKPQQSKPAAASSAAAKTKSLFGDQSDDDDDGDDLFGGPPPLPEPIKQAQPKKVSQKIFSDDSSDDDLFGGGGGGAAKTAAPRNPPKSSAGRSTSTTLAMPKSTKTNEKLFSDSEDDDLFGGSKSKPTESPSKNTKPTAVAKAIKEDPTKSVKALSPSSVDNDPLADLLK